MPRSTVLREIDSPTPQAAATVPGPDWRAIIADRIGSAPIPGNRVTILRNGCEIFPAMLEAIRGARHSIEFATFVYWRGDIAVAVADALAERARAGVEVRVLLDAFGTGRMRRALVDRMQAGGVVVRRFRPLLRTTPNDYLNRNHRKILVVDGCLGFTGGVGIAEQWDGDARNPDEWRDTHCRIDGPAGGALRACFWDMWVDSGGDLRDGIDLPCGAERHADGSDIQLVPVVPDRCASTARLLFTAITEWVHHRLWLSAPYFAPKGPLVDALVDAAERGVEVEIMLPGRHLDKRYSEAASRPEMRRLLRAGVRIWRYQTTMLHAKIAVADDSLAMLGSININQRSMKRDLEANLAFHDPAIIRTLADQFIDDRSQSVPETLETLAQAPLSRKLLGAVARPFRSQL